MKKFRPSAPAVSLLRGRYIGAALAFAVLGSALLYHSFAVTGGIAGDLNDDGKVDVYDLSQLLSAFNQPSATRDLNSDGTVTLTDVSVLLSNYSKTATTPLPKPSGAAIPLGDLPGWKQTFVDDFNKDAPLGSWGTADSQKVVYIGDHGGKWVEYPDGWSSTYTNGSPGYQPAQVLSVHDGVLDFYLHSVNGLPSGANPSPLVTPTSRFQTYGRYAARIKSDTSLSNYHVAWLLWPVNDSDGACAESDFPEANLDSTVTAFAHNATDCSDYSIQNVFGSSTPITGGWHTYVQEWTPGVRRYYIDGALIGTSTTRVWSQNERWQLQTEPSGSGSAAGHLLVDWVAAWKYTGN
jgi:hypothetical protein